MKARLIVNADDFGLTPGINRAVAELRQAGVITSATLMANGPAFEDAVQVAKAHPEIGVGCHVVLVDGMPLSDSASIPTLINAPTGKLRSSLSDFVFALLSGRIREEDIATEALAQVLRIQSAGITITHLDTHKHTHLFPAVLRALLTVSQQTGIRAIRNPFEPVWTTRLQQGTILRRSAVRLTDLARPSFHRSLCNSTLQTTDGTLAISATGDLRAETLHQILCALPASGTFELCCHPGYNDCDLARITTRLRAHRDAEREALLGASQLLNHSQGPELIHYGALLSKQTIVEAATV